MFGGADFKKTLRAALSFLFDDQLLSCYTWNGTAGKEEFKKFEKIHSLIKISTRNHHTFTDHEYKEFLKEYLKHARNRSERKKKKN